MHELSVCISLIRQVEAVARDSRATAIRRISLSIGPLSGVDPTLLAAAFPHASRGSLAEGASLEIRETGLRLSCAACGQESEANIGALICGSCGSHEVQLLSGNELLLETVSLEIPEDAQLAAVAGGGNV